MTHAAEKVAEQGVGLTEAGVSAGAPSRSSLFPRPSALSTTIIEWSVGDVTGLPAGKKSRANRAIRSVRMFTHRIGQGCFMTSIIETPRIRDM